MKRFYTIKGKLNLIIMAITISSLLCAGVAFFAYDQQKYREDLVNELTILARIVGDRSTAALTFDDSEMATVTLST